MSVEQKTIILALTFLMVLVFAKVIRGVIESRRKNKEQDSSES